MSDSLDTILKPKAEEITFLLGSVCVCGISRYLVNQKTEFNENLRK